MDILFDNEDSIVSLLTYINKYNFYNMIEETSEISRSLEMLYNLCHTCKIFREIILNKKYKFPSINSIMIRYKRENIITKIN